MTLNFREFSLRGVALRRKPCARHNAYRLTEAIAGGEVQPQWANQTCNNFGGEVEPRQTGDSPRGGPGPNNAA